MNPTLARIAPSLIRSIHARKRRGDIDLGLGEPTLAPDLAAFEAAMEWTRSHGSPYSPNAGFPELREGIASYLNASATSPDLTGNHVCVTVGSEEALYLAIKSLVDPARDEVLIVEPCYLAYQKICVLEGIPHRMVPLSPEDDFRPDPERVVAAVRPETRMIVLNTPCNPTGRVWTAEHLETLASALSAAGRGDVHLLSDEVYRELYYGSVPPPAVRQYHPHTLTAGSLSKSCALTGLRLGWLAGPHEVITEAIKVHQFVNTAASTFAQRVAIDLLREPGRIGEQRRHYVTARALLLAAAAPAALDLIPPEGAFYALVRLPRGSTDSVIAAESLLEEERVVTVPGRAFGESAEGWLRISWVAPAELLQEGVRRIGDWMRRRSDSADAV